MRSEQKTIKDDAQATGSNLNTQIKAELVKRRAQQLQKELRQLRLQQVAASSWKNMQDLLAALLDMFQAVRTAFVGRILRPKPRPAKRSRDFSDILKERASNLTQSIAERGQAIAEYRDDLSHELRNRRRRVKRTLQKQNRQLQKKLQKQFQQQQKRTFWIAASCAFGLTLASIFSYQLLRHRLQQRKEEEAALELPIDSPNGKVTNAAPPDAVFVGVTSTKLYYPIETPLDPLPMRDNSSVDIVYFASEQEASKEGFQPAQSY